MSETEVPSFRQGAGFYLAPCSEAIATVDPDDARQRAIRAVKDAVWALPTKKRMKWAGVHRVNIDRPQILDDFLARLSDAELLTALVQLIEAREPA